MEFTLWSIECSKIKTLKSDIELLLQGVTIKLFETGSEKLDLIEYVDERIDLIFIEGSDAEQLKKLIYFFREFNQLLEFIPILLYTDFDTFKEVSTAENVGIIDLVSTQSSDVEICFRIKHGYDVVFKTKELRAENYSYRTELRDNYKQLEYQKRRSEELLLNILPEETSRELMIHGFAKPQFYKRVTVLFTDFKGFTNTCERMLPEDIVKELDFFFSKFDEISERHYAEKIKTIGDAYMCAGGIPMRNNSNPVDMVLIGLEMQEFMMQNNAERAQRGEEAWNLRVGIHTGKLIAGVIGRKKFAYDIWGDAVNTASRMESSGEPGMVNISGETYKYIRHLFECEYRGKVYAKNKGEIDMYFVKRIIPEYSIDETGIRPNEQFIWELAQL
ncbi:MAG: adenylate/guanylate cyclase domain-containing protein [Bacteroidales bacterium]|nr:adenylate/guanylate cyclase domain-containing protein [Bacteroidales bacterium]